jgi:hypothetical protein
MTSAAELRVIAARIRPFLPAEAERLREIAAEHARMAEVLDQEVGQAAAEWRAVGAFW